jgi:transposase-like protein
MAANLQNPIFTDDHKAREWLEARVWPNGPVCPHCGVTSEHVTALHGKAHRPGVYQCNECREQFTVTVGTVFERSKIPLSKWMAALFMLTASKKGVSSHQIHRSLDVSYKTAWFMMHRLREAMRPAGTPPLGGGGKVVEADETFIGRLEGQPKAKAGWATRTLFSRLSSAAVPPVVFTSIARRLRRSLRLSAPTSQKKRR